MSTNVQPAEALPKKITEILQFIGFSLEALDRGRTESVALKIETNKKITEIMNILPFVELSEDAMNNPHINALFTYATEAMGGAEAVKGAKEEMDRMIAEREKDDITEE